MNETLKLKDLSYDAVCGIIAQVVQAANRQYVEAIGGRAVNLTWEQLPEVQKQSLMKAVRITVLAPKTLEESHDIWCDELKTQGYTLAKRIDHIRKTHPNLVRFNELSFEEQLKDALFLGILSIFASALGLGEPPEAAREEELADPIPDGEGAETIGEAAKTAQEMLDNMGPVINPDLKKEGYVAGEEGYEDPEQPDHMAEIQKLSGIPAEALGKDIQEPELPLPPDEAKLAVEPEDDNNGVKEPTQAPLPTEEVQEQGDGSIPAPMKTVAPEDPVDHEATKEKVAKAKTAKKK